MNKEFLKYAVESGKLTKTQAVIIHYAGLLVIIVLVAFLVNEAWQIKTKQEKLGCASLCSCREMINNVEIIHYPPYSNDSSAEVPQSYYDYTGKTPPET